MGVTVLEGRDLFRFFHTETDETIALRGVSVRITAGEVVAILGPSGSGKSTLLGCLAGLDVPDGGQVLVDGLAISRQPEAFRARLRARTMGYVAPNRNLIEHLSVRDNVQLSVRLAGLRGSSPVLQALDLVGLTNRAGAPPSKLSAGESVRAGLAVAIAKKPRILLADEPTAELDRQTELSLLGHLKELATSGCAVAIATHSQAVASVADRVVELRDGCVLSA